MTPMLKPPTKLLKNGTHQFTRSVYKVEWYQAGKGVVEKYVVADTKSMAIAKAKRKWGLMDQKRSPSEKYLGVFATLMFKKGHITGFYGPPNVDLR